MDKSMSCDVALTSQQLNQIPEGLRLPLTDAITTWVYDKRP